MRHLTGVKKAGLAALFIISCAFANLNKQGLNLVFIGDSITYGGGHEGRTPPIHAARILRDKYYFGDVNYSNQGFSGFTTANFLPGTAVWIKLKAEASRLCAEKPDARLVFSIMLGTNDSADQGPLSSPVSPSTYRKNMQLIIDSLSAAFPQASFVINHPLWYSENTQNAGARYLRPGLDRLKSYIPEIHQLVKDCRIRRKNWVYEGDAKAFSYFEKNYSSDFYPEQGPKGTFYLHPNDKGAEALAEFWTVRLNEIFK